jgi:hypothetical protein
MATDTFKMPVFYQNALMMSGENDDLSMDHQQNYLVTNCQRDLS